MSRIPDGLLDAIRERVPLVGLVQRQVRLKKTGANWAGLCPFHREKRPSFTVNEQRRRYHCFGCGASGDVFAWVVATQGGEFRDAVAMLAAEAGLETELGEATRRADWAAPLPAPQSSPARRGDEGPSEDDRRRWAWERWEAGEALSEACPAAQYLAGRGLWPLPAPAHAVLRQGRDWHPDTDGRHGPRHPVLLARVDGGDGKLTAVHRTFLAPRDGGGWGKLGVERAKMVLGPMAGGAVRLGGVAQQLGLAEGIETALAARALTGLPTWACISAGGLEVVELPFDVERVVVFADRDKPSRHAPEGRGLQAARRASEALRRRAVAVEVRMPNAPFGDYADVLADRIKGGAA